MAVISDADLQTTRAIVRDVLQVSNDALERGTLDDVGCDQLCRVEIAIQLQDAFDIEVVHESGWQTLADILDAVAIARAGAA